MTVQEIEQLAKIKSNARKLMRAAVALAASKDLASAYGIEHTVTSIVERIGCTFDEVENLASLGYIDDTRNMPNDADVIGTGDALIRHVRGYGDLHPLAGLVCNCCGRFLSVKGSCAEMVAVHEYNQR